MEKDVRLFNCARCHEQTLICGCCDRGNIYCSSTCSKAARSASVRAAGRRYQNSYEGRLKHAARQKRYRERLCKKVTHQGSPTLLSNDSLSAELIAPDTFLTSAKVEQQCHFCHKKCSGFVRVGFMQRKEHVQKHKKTSWPLGP